MTRQRLRWLSVEASHAERIGQIDINIADLRYLLEAAEKAQALEKTLVDIADADYRGNRSPESIRARRVLDAWGKA